MVVGPLIGAGVRAFAAGGARLAAGTKWGTRAYTAYENRALAKPSVWSGGEDPRAIFHDVLDCSVPLAEIRLRAQRRCHTGRLVEAVENYIATHRGDCADVSEAAGKVASTVASAAGTVALAGVGLAAIGAGAAYGALTGGKPPTFGDQL
jgi:hypothetical protein